MNTVLLAALLTGTFMLSEEGYTRLKQRLLKEGANSTALRVSVTVSFENKLESSLDNGYHPTSKDLFFLVKTSPESTDLIRRIIDNYDIDLNYLDDEGNNLLTNIPLSTDATPTILLLLVKKIDPFHKNKDSISFYDRFANVRFFPGKREIFNLMQEFKTSSTNC